jgi:putative membrane protein insertion efficiency factor
MMTRFLLAALDFYRRWLSPAVHSLSPGGCRFQPTCSDYAAIAIATHGPLRGSALAVWRLLRCHPFSKGGLDQVPLQVPLQVPPQVPPPAMSRSVRHEPLP